jgi:hypothetical protein
MQSQPDERKGAHIMTITKDDFNAYERVRRLGVVNMFDVRTVGQLSGLTKPQIIAIMKEYRTLNVLFTRQEQASVTIQAKETQ